MHHQGSRSHHIILFNLVRQHWKWRVVVPQTLSSLVARQVVDKTKCDVASDAKLAPWRFSVLSECSLKHVAESSVCESGTHSGLDRFNSERNEELKMRFLAIICLTNPAWKIVKALISVYVADADNHWCRAGLPVPGEEYSLPRLPTYLFCRRRQLGSLAQNPDDTGTPLDLETLVTLPRSRHRDLYEVQDNAPLKG